MYHMDDQIDQNIITLLVKKCIILKCYASTIPIARKILRLILRRQRVMDFMLLGELAKSRGRVITN